MTDKETARQKIAALVEKYRNTPKKQLEGYTEQQTREYFILPLFRALGWDTENPSEFSAEEQISRGFVDFGFYLNSVPVFYLETKRIAESIDKPEHMRQSTNYSYLKGVTWAVLSDFEGTMVFNAEWEETDPLKMRFLDLQWEHYAGEQFEDLWLLSKSSFQTREIDRVAERFGRKAKKEPVTDALFRQLTGWRRELFQQMRTYGTKIWSTDPRAVDNAVQKFLDRLIFLRTVEDRGVESGHLKEVTRQAKGKDLFPNLLKLFREMDAVYNSNLFAESELDYMEVHDPDLLRGIVDGLYRAPGGFVTYDFNAITADILGAVYEQYLGFKALDPEGKQDLRKQEKRKKQGIYYTPQFVVRYIVRQTLGKLLESGADPHSLRILDPACGSGSFLIEAFDVLDRWLAQHGTAEDKQFPRRRRLRILQENLYGVDLDDQAVEVTRLNLMLRAASERSKLPPLTHILHGNSLIDDESIAGKETAFKWDERFPEVFAGRTRPLWFVTFVTHNSRVSERMVTYGVQTGEPIIFAPEEQLLMAQIIAEACQKYEVPVVAWNILPDHVHMVVAADDETALNEAIRKIKGYSSFAFKQRSLDKGLKPLAPEGYGSDKGLKPLAPEGYRSDKGLKPLAPEGYGSDKGLKPLAPEGYGSDKGLKPLAPEGYGLDKGLKPLAPEGYGSDKGLKPLAPEGYGSDKGLKPLAPEHHAPSQENYPIWAQKFNRQAITDTRALAQIVEYVMNNHHKHSENWGDVLIRIWEDGLPDKGLQPLAQIVMAVCVSPEEATHVPGGFDVVIGNPPYVRQETLGAAFKAYAEQHYDTYAGTNDLYVYFIEKSLRLLKPGGKYGVIVANKWMRANYGKALRRWLKGQALEEIIDFGDLPVFPEATAYPCILIAGKSDSHVSGSGHEADNTAIERDKGLQPLASRTSDISVTQVKTLDFTDLQAYIEENRYLVAPESLDDSGWSLARTDEAAILDKMRRVGVPLGEYVNGEIYYGIKTGLNEAFVIDAATRDRLIREDARSAELIKPFLAGRDVKRYEQPEIVKYLISIPDGWTVQMIGDSSTSPSETPPTRGLSPLSQKQLTEEDTWEWFSASYPAISRHLEPFADRARARWDKGEYWWELRPCAYYEAFEQPKIMYPDISTRGNFLLDANDHFYCGNTVYFISASSKYLVGILNSNLITYFYASASTQIRGGYLRFFQQYVAQLPIRRINFDDSADTARHDRMVELVETMLRLKAEQAAESPLSDRRHEIAEHIERTDRAIDALVYELYGLTEDEIRIVEQGV